MTLHDYAELVSLGLTAPAVILGVLVAWAFLSRAMEGFRNTSRTAIEWFAMGIVIGFAGSALDNIYWSFPWAFSFLGTGWADAFFNFGVYPNIIFRQSCGIAAAYCHLRCAVHYVNDTPDVSELYMLHRIFWWSLSAGVALSVLLYLLR